jgi:hypothetical protein
MNKYVIVLPFILPGEGALMRHFERRFAVAFEYMGKDSLPLYLARGCAVNVMRQRSMDLERVRKN